MPVFSSPDAIPASNPLKRRTGLARIAWATRNSLSGLKAAWGEPAFRQEAIIAMLLLPASMFIGRGLVETSLLAGSVLLVLIVEVLNTAVEAAIDRVGPEWHALSKRAKDAGSAAVMLALLLCAGVWSAAVFQRFFA